MFVHGIGESTNTFTPLIEASSINKTHRLVSLDLEGHGRSPLRPGLQELSIEDFSESVGEVLKVLGIHRPVILVSHSLGGVSWSFGSIDALS
jgi:pimeloyl-ACP methyl ester carboxylesterase